MQDSLALFVQFLPLLITLTLVVGGLSLLNWTLRRRYKDQPDKSFRFQMIMLVLTLVGVLAIIIALPVKDSLRGQLLSLIGILLSAAIALSSTTFIGNMMAGIMLKIIRSARPGDFITVGDLTGRITEMDLLHTEIQTEFRDLVTVPNLHMVTNPMKVVRASGTIITAEVSLGYELPHSRVCDLLRKAAENSGLKDGFAHVRELGDFSVTYRIAGLLEDVQSLISARARLRGEVLDTLHAAGVEIVSPNFMNTRALAGDTRTIPPTVRQKKTTDGPSAEQIAFDKADDAASIEEIRKALEKLDAELAKEDTADSTREILERRKAALVTRLETAIKQKEELHKD